MIVRLIRHFDVFSGIWILWQMTSQNDQITFLSLRLLRTVSRELMFRRFLCSSELRDFLHVAGDMEVTLVPCGARPVLPWEGLRLLILLLEVRESRWTLLRFRLSWMDAGSVALSWIVFVVTGGAALALLFRIDSRSGALDTLLLLFSDTSLS